MPRRRQRAEVAKLIDVCEVHRLQGLPVGLPGVEPDLREEVGVNDGVYDNPLDLTPNMFTLMRFTEWDNPGTAISSG